MRTMAQTRTLGRQDATALSATGADHAATTFGSHAGAKAVSALTANNGGLKCTFHDCLARYWVIRVTTAIGRPNGVFRRLRNEYRARFRRKALNYSF